MIKVDGTCLLRGMDNAVLMVDGYGGMDNAVFMVDGTCPTGDGQCCIYGRWYVPPTGDGQCCIYGRLKPCYAPANPGYRHRSLLDR